MKALLGQGGGADPAEEGGGVIILLSSKLCFLNLHSWLFGWFCGMGRFIIPILQGLSKGPRTTEYKKPISPKTHLSLVGKGGREKSNQKQLSMAG